MLSDYFSTNNGALCRAESAAVAPYLDSFADALRILGYGHRSIVDHLRVVIHFATWARASRIQIAELNEEHVDRFGAHLPTCRCPGPRPRRCRCTNAMTKAARFLTHLRENGTVQERPPRLEASDPTILSGFSTWMEEHRGARPATLLAYCRILRDAIDVLGEDPHRYEVAGLRAFVVDRSKRHGRSKAKLIVTAMRMFLRYLIAEGLCPVGFDDAIPTIARWRLAALPRYLSPSDVQRIVASCDAATPSGSRDRAILLLLSRLGLRAGDVAGLRFSDFDWKGAKVRVAGKSRRTNWLPLPQDVGDSILAYLHEGRPTVEVEQVFIRCPPPRRPITASTVCSVVRRAIERSGVVTPVRGAHVLRHSAAFAMLEQGASLEQIRTVLRHQDTETTIQYAKVDLATLHQVVRPWPEVSP